MLQDVLAFGVSISVSLMFFGFALLWRLRNSISDIFSESILPASIFWIGFSESLNFVITVYRKIKISGSLLVTDAVGWMHYAMYGLMVGGLFSNSFVVNESSLVAFCVTTSVTLHAYSAMTKTSAEGRKNLHFLLVLGLLGLIRYAIISV